jgi:hypothetical protein
VVPDLFVGNQDLWMQMDYFLKEPNIPCIYELQGIEFTPKHLIGHVAMV